MTAGNRVGEHQNTILFDDEEKESEGEKRALGRQEGVHTLLPLPFHKSFEEITKKEKRWRKPKTFKNSLLLTRVFLKKKLDGRPNKYIRVQGNISSGSFPLSFLVTVNSRDEKYVRCIQEPFMGFGWPTKY